MKLLTLKLRHFKGIAKLDLDAAGEDITVYGDNATGKTTIADAFTFLLFGKDTSGRADFQVKTLQADGEAKHNLEHSVEGTLDTGDSVITLQRIYKEKWTTPRGAAREQFSGHETEYLIDGVPMRKVDYDARVKQLADEETFRLLTDPLYFNKQLHWEDRRRILIDLAGDVTQEDVISHEPKLAKLPDVLAGRTPEDAKAVLEASRKRINRELAELPVRIDEITAASPEVTGSREDAEAKLAAAEARLAELNEELAEARAGGGAAAVKERIATARAELTTHEASRRKAAEGDLESLRARSRVATQRSHEARLKYDRLAAKVNELTLTLKRREAERDELRERYRARHAIKYVAPASDTTCPHCGQPLPEAKVAAAKASAVAQFNEERARALASIQAEGKRVAKLIHELEEEVTAARDAAEAAQQEALDAESAAHGLSEGIADAEAKLARITDDSDAKYLRDQIAEAEAELARIHADGSDQVDAIKGRIAAADALRRQHEAEIARHDAAAKITERVAALEARESELTEEHEKITEGLYLLDLYVRAKAELLTDKINSRFEFARFQLFREQINEGLRATCVTTYNGVPFSDLNHGAQLNVGLDIIRTLSAHHDFTPPVFVDNAESVTKLLEMPGQMIRLVVSADDATLRIVTA